MSLFGSAGASGLRVIIPKKKFVGEPSVRSFETKIRGQIIKGFVVKKGNQYFAYQNLCKHLPVTLDLNDDNFFTHDKKHLQCHMHGAMYEVETGFCVAGPCQGARLTELQIKDEPTQITIILPESLADS